jgi:serine/threonine protein kinase
MHECFFIHRDIKLSNLLLNNRGILKVFFLCTSPLRMQPALSARASDRLPSISISIQLADMGLARPAAEPPEAKSPNVVTLWYRAPELLFGFPKYSAAVRRALYKRLGG